MMLRPLKTNSVALSLRSVEKLAVVILIACVPILFSNCTQFKEPKVEPFFAVTVPPPKQELRWSNGKAPKTLDPARVATAPETDIVRAIYDGLTDLDSKNLVEIPGVAEKWESTKDLRTWTFHLRKDAHWSNGERVTARDFVVSWTRLSKLVERPGNSYLFQNIIGMGSERAGPGKPPEEPAELLHQTQTPLDSVVPGDKPDLETGTIPKSSPVQPAAVVSKVDPKALDEKTTVKTTQNPIKFGVEAIDEVTLKVSLNLPDKDFARLVSNPIFRPVYSGGANFTNKPLDPDAVTNGAFRITKIGDDGITVDRSENYWNKKAVRLESVRFVPASSAEMALEAYKKGDLDVLTNAAFEPLALKLLAPYEDFRRVAHTALNFYEFNSSKAPFSDRRVREALTISIDRVKLNDGDLEGLNQPAFSFFPLRDRGGQDLALDAAKARVLIEKAGYPNGLGFPQIRLVVNRNDTQNRVARSVARMWKQNLNIDTVIVVRESSEIEEIRRSGDFDLVRRGVVLHTNDELVNLALVLGSAQKAPEKLAAASGEVDDASILLEKREPLLVQDNKFGGPSALDPVEQMTENSGTVSTLTEEDAIYELKAIPLYFPTSYSLVKPYVQGFETNGLDALSLNGVSIDNSWQPRSSRKEQ